jgi:hypothetical protein
MSGIPTTNLVNTIFDFCETLTGITLFPYQEQFSKRIIRSVLENDGSEITALFGRQMGKCFAKGTEILMSDGHVKKVEDIRVGECVMHPDSTPAKVTALGRGCERMYEIRSRERNHESFVVNESHILSVIDCKDRKVHSYTVKDYLNLLDGHKTDNLRGYRVAVNYPDKRTRIEPYFFGVWLGSSSSYDAKITNTDQEVIEFSGLIGNMHIPDDFMINSRRNRLELLAGIIDTDESRGKENVLEITFKSQRLAYDVVRLLRSLGFRASSKEKYIKSNSKRFLVYRINAYGDFSIVPTRLKRRQWKSGGMRENSLTFRFDVIPKGIDDYYGFTTDSSDRLFLLGDYTVVHNTECVAATVCGLMVILPQLAVLPAFELDKRLQMFQKGLWVGIFAPGQRQAQITFSRLKSRLLSKTAIAILNDQEFSLEFSTSNGQTIALTNGSFVTAISASDNSNIMGESFHVVLLDESQDISNNKIKREIHPMAAAYNGTIVKIGTATGYRGDFYDAIQRNKNLYDNKLIPIRNHFEYDWKIGAKYNPKYSEYVETEKRRLGENSDAFLMSYCLKWLLERGMFIGDLNKFLLNCGEPDNERITFDRHAMHVVGIDVGGSSGSRYADSTIVTVIEIDWNNPVFYENRIDLETNEEYVFKAYNMYIKDWLELQVPDYEEQYTEITRYLKNFRIVRCVCDATRESSIAHRLRANTQFEVVPFVFSSKSKSDLYKHLDYEISSARVRIPTGPLSKESREFERFVAQFEDLTKTYNGANLVVKHPDIAGTHDDYCDSLALAVWGCMTEGLPNDTQTIDRQKFIGRDKQISFEMQARNRLTAKRR